MTVVTGAFGGVESPREPTEQAIYGGSQPWRLVSVASAHVATETGRLPIGLTE